MPSPILLLDGGLGTTLESPPYNNRFSSSTPLWSSHLLISSPETLSSVQRDFVRNGADVLLTATYQASLEGFAATPREASQLLERTSDEEKNPGDRAKDHKPRVGYDRNEAAAFMRSAVSIAHSAISQSPSPRKTLVALSLGAYGATLHPSQEYTGTYPFPMLTTPHLQSWHADRLSVFTSHLETWNSIDFIASETIPLLAEIRAVRRVMAEANTGEERKRWWISCVFPNEDLRLADGSEVKQVVEAMIAEDWEREQVPWGIGVNCTKVGKLKGLVQEFEDTVRCLVDEGRAKTEWPWLVLYPDGAQGLVYNTRTQNWETKEGEEEVQRRRSWDDEVYNIVREISERARWNGILAGGCCKTTPEDIGNLRKRVDERGIRQV